MKTSFIIFGVIVFASFIAWWLLWPNSFVSKQQLAPTITNAVTSVTVDALAINPNSINTTNIGGSNSMADIASRYEQGLITKGQAMQEILMEQNEQPQNFYGRVIDQNGKPIVGADITGNLGYDFGFESSEKSEVHKTQTDSAGFFQFTGLHGARFGVTARKAGYEMGMRGEGYKSSIGQKTTPDDRATFMMWKLRGAEPIEHIRFQSRVPYNGTTATFNLQPREKVKDNGGDLRITLLRSPLEITPGLLHPYDWQVKIELVNGGILKENDPYPYWAPENGFEPFFETNVSSNDVLWNAELRQYFYIKNAQGQYGRLFINLSTNSKRPDTGIAVELWINPSGSRNLEFDPAKQVP